MDDSNVLSKIVLVFFAGMDDALTLLEDGKIQEAKDCMQRVLFLTEEMLLAAGDEDEEIPEEGAEGIVDELAKHRKKDEKS